MNKQRVAHEWLIALGAIGFGVTVWPPALGTFHVINLDGFYESLFGGDEWASALLVVAAPYAAIQLGRSVIWAIKTSVVPASTPPVLAPLPPAQPPQTNTTSEFPSEVVSPAEALQDQPLRVREGLGRSDIAHLTTAVSRRASLDIRRTD